MASAVVGYDPNNADQTKFLSALALGETGNAADAYTLGTHGTNLASNSTDEYGFPQWGGFGNSHAAGAYQFQPGTWDGLAQQYGLNFHNPSDQNEGAWYYAQQQFAAKTGGSLSDALAAGEYGKVQSALVSAWPSVTGNGSSPGLAAALANGLGSSNVTPGAASGSQAYGTTAAGGANAASGSGLASWLVRGGLILIGGLILVVALWQLLSDHSSVPSPGSVAKGAAKFATA